MFTSTMTAKEMIAKYLAEKDAVTNTIVRLGFEFKRNIQKRHKGFPYYKVDSFKSHNKNEYFLASMAKDRDIRHAFVILLFSYMSSSGRIYIVKDDDDKSAHRFDSHLLKRYKERLGYADEWTLEQTLGHLVFEIHRHIEIYNVKKDDKTNNIIYACDGGILLCTSDDNTNITDYNTFVADDQLQPTQRMAKEKVLESLYDNSDYVQVEVLEEAAKIYSKYYDSAGEYIEFLQNNAGDSIKLNFVLKKTTNKDNLNKGNSTLDLLKLMWYLEGYEFELIGEDSGYRHFSITDKLDQSKHTVVGYLNNHLLVGPDVVLTQDCKLKDFLPLLTDNGRELFWNGDLTIDNLND